MAMQSSSSSFSYRFSNDVFLSFRGEDTRHSFTGNLYKALSDRGIHTFIDDKKLPRGDQISSALEKAIEESRIFIIVLSENYASSSFCLNELGYILKFIKGKGLLVLPVFYKVDPSDVRNHAGSFGESLAHHEKKFNADKETFKCNLVKLETWKMALHQVANLSGYHFKHGEEYEYKFIQRIVELVSKKINRVPLHVADYPVGLESRMQEVKALLDVGSDDVVHMLGIHGLGGVGKTTLAAAVYNSIADHFEALCFLENVRETSKKHGIQHLQSNLLSETVGEHKLIGVKQGISIIQHRLQQQKILLILDDVDKREQLQALAGRPDLFGLGSRVIITTRDKQLLACHGVERTYEVNELNEEHALELLSWKAFKLEKVDPFYKDVLNRAATYASGLPLALEVIGSNLYGRNIEQWISALDRYKRIPNKEIQEILKVSYDALEEDEQSVFLDIACCFKKYGLVEVEDILHAHHGHCMKHHIGVLVEKSLIKISCDGNVTLHDLIEDMGKEIVRQESVKEPGKRSRLWFPKDIVQVLEENKKFVNLTSLNFDYCQYLTHIPDVFCLPHLENLSFQWCQNLSAIHYSVGFLEKLKILDGEGCSRLKSFPAMKLTSLEQFKLRYCHSLESFPEILGRMESIKELDLKETPVKKFPLSFGNLTRLQKLQLSLTGVNGIPLSSLGMMPDLVSIIGWRWELSPFPEDDDGAEKVSSTLSSNIQYLQFRCCNLTDDFFRIVLPWFANVKNLDLPGNSFTVIPECIKECHFLTRLNLNYCEFLREIRGIPPNLKYFSAIECRSLTSSCRSKLLNQDLHEGGSTFFYLPGANIPEWFEFQTSELPISFWFRNKLPAIAICLVMEQVCACEYSSSSKGDTLRPLMIPTTFRLMSPIVIINGNEQFLFDSWEMVRMGSDCTCLFDLRETIQQNNLNETLLENEWNHAVIKCPDLNFGQKSIKNGIHLLKQESSMEDFRFTNPFRKRKLVDDFNSSES
ncbi:hypothetical protein GLYMA_19G054700v4 [Glycine max]|nr:disease resistance protein RPV1 isoform X2 [Glycine max]KAG4395874.1 hypothetical protein GLYMA_19G054700v4 [Glycine max]KAH1076516.1 hypothetical protein GYH30_052139 [Glycine max]|eukprot:XP_006604004.1 TMV resistance protein N isoform X2 [Glycine max]